MSQRSEAEAFTLRVGRQYATACGQRLVSAFDNTLDGDLARLQVRQRLHRAFPGMSRSTVDRLIRDLLTP